MIPFLDLRAEQAEIGAEVRAAIEEVLARGQYILGPEVAAFEREFAAFLGVAHAVGVASGTDALHLALRACGIGPGDEVITVSNTAVATVAAIELAGARPVFVDVDPATLNLDPALVEAALTPRTRALLPVHLYGRAADLAPLLAIAGDRGLRVIEDACQAHGARYRGRAVGAWGDAGCFSFYPTKNLGGLGDGGMVTTNDAALAERLRLMREYGWVDRNRPVLRGMNSRLDELQAAVLRRKLACLPTWNGRRLALTRRYNAGLAGLAGITPPAPGEEEAHVHHLYVIRAAGREALREALTRAGVGTAVHYPTPIHLQAPYRDLGFPVGSLPVAERAASEILSLPLHPHLSDGDADRVIAAVRECAPAVGTRGGSRGG